MGANIIAQAPPSVHVSGLAAERFCTERAVLLETSVSFRTTRHKQGNVVATMNKALDRPFITELSQGSNPLQLVRTVILLVR